MSELSDFLLYKSVEVLLPVCRLKTVFCNFQSVLNAPKHVSNDYYKYNYITSIVFLVKFSHNFACINMTSSCVHESSLFSLMLIYFFKCF